MTGPKTIVFVESGIGGGGSFESLKQHLKYLNRDAFKPVVVFLNHTRYVKELGEMKVPVYLVYNTIYNRKLIENPNLMIWIRQRAVLLPSLFAPFLSLLCEKLIHKRSIFRLKQIMDQEDAHLLHTNNQVNRDLYAVIAAQEYGIPCVAHLRSFFSLGFNAAKASFANKSVSRFVAYSPTVAEHWISRGIQRNKMEIVFNAIGEIKSRARDLQADLGIPRGSTIIGAVGRIIPERGYDQLIRAFALLVSKLEKAHLVIIGGGETSRMLNLRKLAQKLGVAAKVVFAGRRDRASDFIGAMDVLVLPYSIEPFGRVLLEAWSLGVPAIVTDVGGIRDIIANGDAALVVPNGNVEALSQAIYRVITKDELYRNMMSAGRKLLKDRFDIRRYASEIHRIYDEVLEEVGSDPAKFQQA